ncbi:peptidase, partial [Streptomyces sp. AC04842]|nr:peptidase [Streptomyces sp. AC04842]
MDGSGGRGQPRPGNDESAEHTGPEAQAPGGTGDAPTTPSAPTPADAQDARPEGPEGGTPQDTGAGPDHGTAPTARPPRPARTGTAPRRT